MMSADDEPQIPVSTDKKIPTINLANTNSLINEAFNINNSIGGIQPISVLPPSSNHFQPVQHSRTPSVEVKDLHKPIDPPQPAFKQSSSLFSNSPINPPPVNSAALFFDQPNLNIPSVSFNPITTNKISPNGENKSPTNQPAPPSNTIFAPIPTKPGQFTNLTTPPTLSNLPPPSTVPPPISMPPPVPPSGLASAGSNPYAAKGALNKKVYDKGTVSVAPAQPINSALFKNEPQNEPTSNLFMPPPITSSSTSSLNSTLLASPPSSFPLAPPNSLNTSISSPLSSSTTSLVQNSSSPNLYMPPQPQIIEHSLSYQAPTQGLSMSNLNERLTTSMSFGSGTDSSLNNNQPMNQNKNMWNWFSQNKILNTFVEKAKHGVESIVTAVDPQMKDYIHPANRAFLVVSSISNPKLLHSVREGFSNAGFSKINISPLDVPTSSQFAPQIVGFPCALQSAKEKLDNTLFQTQNQPDCVCLAYQDFLAELATDCWFELAVIMLKDKANNIDLTVYTDAIPVSLEDITQLKEITPHDYALKWSGFSIRLPEKNFNFNFASAGNYSFLTYETADTVVSQSRISSTLKTLALLFKNKLLLPPQLK